MKLLFYILNGGAGIISLCFSGRSVGSDQFLDIRYVVVLCNVHSFDHPHYEHQFASQYSHFYPNFFFLNVWFTIVVHFMGLYCIYNAFRCRLEQENCIYFILFLFTWRLEFLRGIICIYIYLATVLGSFEFPLFSGVDSSP